MSNMPKSKKKRKIHQEEISSEEEIEESGIQEKFEELDEYDGDNQPFQKDFFQISEEMNCYTVKDIEDFKEKHCVSVQGKDVPKPILQFSDYKFPSFFIDEVEKKNFLNPTPIQSQGWPIALSGRNMIGVARTGSGKTLAFLLPALVHIKSQPPLAAGDGPIAVILAPTRELVQQIHEVARGFEFSTKVKSVCVFGGVSKKDQYHEWKKGAEICIATPGRLIDILKSTPANLNRCTYLCIDEADRMLDMGFEPQIRGIIQGIRKDRQTLMFSATWPKSVQALAEDFLNDPVTIRVGSDSLSANKNIRQIVDICRKDQKPDRLLGLLNEIFEGQQRKVLIFVHTKDRADQLTDFIREAGWSVTTIHGDKSQEQRNRSFGHFKLNKTRILVATDVAARGLDVDDITFVINYDYPMTTEDYVHRIGRSGRSEKKGNAYTFFTPHDAKHTKELINILTQANQTINPLLKNMLTREGRAQIQLYCQGISSNKKKFKRR